jgi:hypothetical protein
VRSSSRAALSFAAVLLVAGPARADNQDSETFFAQGRQLRQAGDCPGAITAFRRALEIKPEGLGALRNVADCEELLGQFASARNDWWNLRRAVLQSNDPKYKGWDTDAEAAYAKLASKVARIVVRITGESLDRVRVSIDGKPLDPRLLNVELERDLGLHTVEGAYGGAAPVIEKRVLTVGATETVTLVIPAPRPTDTAPAAIAPVATTTSPVVTPLPPADNVGLRRAGIAAVGVGGLGVVGTVIAIVVRGSALSAVEASCKPGVRCLASQDVADAYSRGKTFSLLANVFGGVGIAGIGAGVAMILVSGSSSAPAPAPAAVKVDAGAAPLPGGGRVWAEVRF